MADKTIQNGEWTYTSSEPVCTGKGNNQTWTTTNCCTCTVGPGAPTTASPQCAVQFSPASAGPPTVTVTDQFGVPIFSSGGLLVFEPSPEVTAKVESQYGLLSPDHTWIGFQSNIPVPNVPGTNGAFYRVTFEWSSPVLVSPLGATWFSDNNDELDQGPVTDAFVQLPPAPGTPFVNGSAEVAYGPALAIQSNPTGFGDSNLGLIDFANGSELDAAYGFIKDGYLWITLAGNLESNFNKLDVFLDYKPGGQNKLRGDNPDVDFNGLNRMGDDGSGNGLTFDPDFAADHYITATCGGNPFATFANTAQLLTGGGGIGRFIGSGGAGGQNLLFGFDGTVIGLDNSNTGGVGAQGGSGESSGAGVKTGVEIQVALLALPGYDGGPIKVCAFINGGGHDFLSNQVLGELPAGTGNLGEPRAVNFGNLAGNQYFVIAPPAAPCPADLNGDGKVDAADLTILLSSWGGGGADLNGDGVTDAADLTILLSAWGGCA
jgi:hypothetical protein